MDFMGRYVATLFSSLKQIGNHSGRDPFRISSLWVQLFLSLRLVVLNFELYHGGFRLE
jgi:phosphoglycerol transferase MdoB-like AlkP superfamily enzyme